MQEPGNHTILIAEGDTYGFVRLDDALASDGMERWYDIERPGAQQNGPWECGAGAVRWSEPGVWGWLGEGYAPLHEVSDTELVRSLLRDCDRHERIYRRWTARAEYWQKQGVGPVAMVVTDDGEGGLIIGGHTDPKLVGAEYGPGYLGDTSRAAGDMSADPREWDEAVAIVGLKRVGEWQQKSGREWVAPCALAANHRYQPKKRGLLARLTRSR